MKTTCAGGSSNVFKSALKALVDSMWTSSMMYTLYAPLAGAYRIDSLRLRISSTPRLEAPSISRTSKLRPSVISLQLSHSLSGF